MTIQEAIKSGEAFRLSDWDYYIRADLTFDEFIYNDSEVRYNHLSVRDILSQKWVTMMNQCDGDQSPNAVA